MKLPTKQCLAVSAGALLAAGLPQAAQAAHIGYQEFKTQLEQINGVGSGMAEFNLDGSMLTVRVTASGLDDGPHVAHIHGRFTPGGDPRDSVLPTLDSDTDEDGFIELVEAIPDYGFVIVPLGVIGTGTSIDFTQTFDLTDPMNFGFQEGDMNNPRYDIDDLLGESGQLFDFREIIVHGQFAPAVGAGTDGEVDGTAGYKAVLPTLGGEIGAVPEPSTWMLMIGGFAAVGAGMRSRKRRTKAALA